jgi:putative spermidine/putrescine transport system substrate-binding protein
LFASQRERPGGHLEEIVKTKRLIAGAAFVAVVAISLTACAGTSTPTSTGKVDAKTATSAADFGGMSALVAAANAEGQLNVITLPPSWANYGKIIDGFKKKYPKITINSANPDGSSADEVSAAKSQKGQTTAPDVFDMGTAVLQQNLDLVAPYKVANWADIPADFKDADGKWYYDYTGLMSVGYDSTVITTAPKSIDDLLGSQYKGKVAIKGDPTQANEAASAVYMAALQSKGSADDIKPGIDFFGKLKKAGNYQAVTPTQATVVSGETPVVIQWSYNNLAWGAAAGSAGNANFKTVVLPGTALGSYYNQAINVDAPHPAAARLWEEYLYTPAVQNLFLASGAYPATLAAMEKAKTVDNAVLSSVGAAPADFVQLTAAQAAKAATLLTSSWASTIG